jgi:hypothetical protein
MTIVTELPKAHRTMDLVYSLLQVAMSTITVHSDKTCQTFDGLDGLDGLESSMLDDNLAFEETNELWNLDSIISSYNSTTSQFWDLGESHSRLENGYEKYVL